SDTDVGSGLEGIGRVARRAQSTQIRSAPPRPGVRRTMQADAATEEQSRQQAAHRVVGASRTLLDSDGRPVRRGQHPKHHACVRARFVVEPSLAPGYRSGLFQPGKVYDAWVRFSNGVQTDDRKPDAHGMAVKLVGVEGPKVLEAEKDATTHDFVMV